MNIKYKIWKDEHKDNCSVNYVGSAPNMECTDALRIFERSQATRGVMLIIMVTEIVNRFKK